MAEDQDPCALRALTLCDGQVLEDPEHAPTECICAALRRTEERCAPTLLGALRARRQELIERTMSRPTL